MLYYCTCRVSAILQYLQGKWCSYLRLEVGLNQRSAMFRGVDKESSEEMDLRPVLNISSLFSYLTKTNRFRDIASTTALQLPHNTVSHLIDGGIKMDPSHFPHPHILEH